MFMTNLMGFITLLTLYREGLRPCCHTTLLCRGIQALVVGVNDCMVVGGVATLLKTQSPPL